jgi:hypothetical protein
MKKWSYKRSVTSFEGDKFVVFHFWSASEIWPDKRGGVTFGEGVLMRGGLLYHKQ